MPHWTEPKESALQSRSACEIGTRLASATITVPESVCPRFQPEELGLQVDELQQISLF